MSLYEADESSATGQHDELCHRLKTLRISHNMTQAELSDSTSLSCRYISDIECGRRQPRFVNLCRIAHGLGISVSELLNFEDDAKEC